MRLYSFQNFYFAGVHAGIQTAHSIAEIAVKYKDGQGTFLHNFHLWASDHKTIIVKNGGMAGDLRSLIELFQREDNPYPWASFNESEYAADGCLTNVSIVVPTLVWKLADAIRSQGNYTMSLGGKTYAVYEQDTNTFADLGEEDGGYSYREYGSYSPVQSYTHHFIYNKKLPASPLGQNNPTFMEISEFDVELIKRMNRCGLM